jgi:alanine racemase
LNAEIIGEFPELFPMDIVTDSRKVFMPQGGLFVALKGPNFNGHDFCDSVFKKGISFFLLSNKETLPKGSNGIIVPDTLAALQQIAQAHRMQFNIPVVGITGSNGKTIVKDWLAELCTETFTVYKSPKSYNSQIGVALSLLGIKEYHDLAIIEAGISRKGEMEKLEKMIAPTLGVITHLGSAHDIGFRSQEEKVKEKSKLFINCKNIVVQDSSVKEKLALSQSKMHVASSLEIGNYPFTQSNDTAISNAKTAICAAQILRVTEDKIWEKVSSLLPLNMRLEQIKGINNCELINDGYSLDMDSLVIALNFMTRQVVNFNKTVIVSDFDTSLEPGEDYTAMAHLFKEMKVNRVIGIGIEISEYRVKFKDFDTEFYDSTSAFLEHFSPDDYKSERILIKGARKYKLERIVSVLQEKVHSTFVEVNLNKLSQNIDFFRSKLSSGTRLMAMVKASSYGSGTHEIANLLEYKKLDYLCVAYPDEGIELRKAGVSIPIMVLNTDINSLHACITHQLEPVVYSMRFLEQVNSATKTSIIKIHLEIDTGMKRLGLEKDEIGLANKIITSNKNIFLVSVFSHLAAADEKSFDSFTQEQISNFIDLSSSVEGSALRHICNTSAILRFPNAHFDLVRLGIGMYGIDPTGENSSLECAMSLKTVVSQIREVKKGESIGYSRNYIATSDMKIGILPIGYADGIKRSLSNGNGKFYVNGTPCEIVGNVCMDMCMIDLTGVMCEEGKEVILFENNEQLNQLARDMGTISYEVFTGISSRVKRVFVEE